MIKGIIQKADSVNCWLKDAMQSIKHSIAPRFFHLVADSQKFDL